MRISRSRARFLSEATGLRKSQRQDLRLAKESGGRPGRRVAEEWLVFHQSSIWTYNETKKESRSIMGHRLWEKVRCQHKVSAPSSSSAITHQSSKKFAQRTATSS